MSQSDNSCPLPARCVRAPRAADERADVHDHTDDLFAVLEDARSAHSGDHGRSHPPTVASLSRLPTASPYRGHCRFRHHNDANADLCETRQTQELGDDFFALYMSQTDAASPDDCHVRGDVNALAAGIIARTAESNNSAVSVSLSDTEDARGDHDNEVHVLSEVRVGRADGHHAQQLQYTPETSEDLEEEEEEEVIAKSTEVPVAPDPSTSGMTNDGQMPPAHPATTSPSGGHCQLEYWPHPHPPPWSALPCSRQTRVAFHTQRYGSFIKAYLGLSDAEVEQAQRRGRRICMIGVRKAPPSSSHVASSVSYATPSSPNSAAAAAPAWLPTFRRHSNHGFGEAVKLQRIFLRHSVLAVEGDAVFSELIDRAEVLYAVEQSRLDAAWRTYTHEIGDAEAGATAATSTASPGSPPERALYPQFRKLPRVAEPCLRPNARCIALHYGLPDRESPDDIEDRASTAGVPPGKRIGEDTSRRAHGTSGDAPRRNPCPRASLMAVVCTTRLEEGDEIYVSLDSYYRCLDEVSWYRRCYGEVNKRYGCSDGATGPHMAAANTAEDEKSAQVGAAAERDLIGDVYTGVKRFPQWPADLAYYHGVGKRHASNVAEAAFPFTLVALGPAPELGNNQMGVVASAWLPYGTCLLYCGPSVATRKIERLVTEGALRGGCAAATGTTTITCAKDEAPTHREAGEEDLSFVTDDTYALGLGRHGVCFGQGLTRYINHRYNTSRFGNVELCSVILSVPSEFATVCKAANTTAAAAKVAPNGDRTEKSKNSSAPLISRPRDSERALSLTAEERARVVRVVTAKRSHRRGRAQRAKKESTTRITEATVAVSVPAPRADGGSAAGSTKSKRRAPRRRTPCLFLEERSFFVTVPFFLVTTDIPPGAPLLAWSYGEDYDAKLERQVVADGHLVPYADAVLLNQRLAAAATTWASSPTIDCRLQRYNGDYRFAVGVGDVVWRRRPVHLGLPLSSSHGPSGDGAVFDAYVPPPEDDLFVVVQTLRSSVEKILLRPLQRVPLTNAQLTTILRDQHQESYISPHAPKSTQPCPQRRRRRVGRKPSASTKQRRAAALSDDCTAHWAVFRLTDINALAPVPLAPTSFCLTPHTFSRYEECLRTCVVATTDSVGLLLMDIDYSAVYSTPPNNDDVTDAGAARSNTSNPPESATRGSTGGKRGSTTKQAFGRGGDVETHRLILVNLDDLRYATSLVRSSPKRAGAVPELCSGLVWPLYCL